MTKAATTTSTGTKTRTCSICKNVETVVIPKLTVSNPITAIAPVPIAAFAGEPSQSIGRSFIKSYVAVCLEGAIIVLACVIFSTFASSPPQVDPNAAAVTQVWTYVGDLAFNLLVLVGTVKMADRVVREMMFGG